MLPPAPKGVSPMEAMVPRRSSAHVSVVEASEVLLTVARANPAPVTSERTARDTAVTRGLKVSPFVVPVARVASTAWLEVIDSDASPAAGIAVLGAMEIRVLEWGATKVD